MDKERLKYVLSESEDLPLPAMHPRAPAQRVLVAREAAGRKCPKGARIIEAWRYLAGIDTV